MAAQRNRNYGMRCFEIDVFMVSKFPQYPSVADSINFPHLTQPILNVHQIDGWKRIRVHFEGESNIILARI